MPTILPRYTPATSRGGAQLPSAEEAAQQRIRPFTARDYARAALQTASAPAQMFRIGMSSYNPMYAVRNFLNANPISRTLQDFQFHLQYNRDRTLGGFVNPAGAGPVQAKFAGGDAPPGAGNYRPQNTYQPQNPAVFVPPPRSVNDNNNGVENLTRVTQTGFNNLTQEVRNVSLAVGNVVRVSHENVKLSSENVKATHESKAKLVDLVAVMKDRGLRNRFTEAEASIESRRGEGVASEGAEPSRRGNSIISGILGAIGRLRGLILPLITGIGAGLAAVMGAFRGGIGTLVRGMGSMFSGSGIARLLAPITRVLGGAFTRMASMIGRLMAPIARMLGPIGTLGGLATRFAGFARVVPVIGQVIMIVMGIINGFRGFIDGFRRSGGNIFERLFNGLVEGARSVVRGIIDPLLWLVDQVKNGVANIMSAFGLDRLAEQMRNFSFQRIFDRMVETFIPNESQLLEAGSMILRMIGRFIRGIRFPGSGRVADYVEGMARGAQRHSDRLLPGEDAPRAAGPVAPAASNGRPGVSHSEQQMRNVIREIAPRAHITGGARSPEDVARLRRQGFNPSSTSYHNRGQALDMRPIPGMTIEQFGDQLRARGINIRELGVHSNGRNPGRHWHFAWENNSGGRGTPQAGNARAAAGSDDMLARLLIGEAGRGGLRGQQAVANVVLNRSARSGQSIEQVITQRRQFEPYGNRRTWNRLMQISPGSREYQEALAAIAAARRSDITNGATHFYSPVAQAQLARRDGRSLVPAWARGQQGVDIGGNVFYNLPFGNSRNRFPYSGSQPTNDRPSAVDTALNILRGARRTGPTNGGEFDTIRLGPRPTTRAPERRRPTAWFDENGRPRNITPIGQQVNPTGRARGVQFAPERNQDGNPLTPAQLQRWQNQGYALTPSQQQRLLDNRNRNGRISGRVYAGNNAEPGRLDQVPQYRQGDLYDWDPRHRQRFFMPGMRRGSWQDRLAQPALHFGMATADIITNRIPRAAMALARGGPGGIVARQIANAPRERRQRIWRNGNDPATIMRNVMELNTRLTQIIRDAHLARQRRRMRNPLRTQQERERERQRRIQARSRTGPQAQNINPRRSALNASAGVGVQSINITNNRSNVNQRVSVGRAPPRVQSDRRGLDW